VLTGCLISLAGVAGLSLAVCDRTSWLASARIGPLPVLIIRCKLHLSSSPAPRVMTTSCTATPSSKRRPVQTGCESGTTSCSTR
jgi:hypothetical protein